MAHTLSGLVAASVVIAFVGQIACGQEAASAWLDCRGRSQAVLHVLAFALPEEAPSTVAVTWGKEDTTEERSLEEAMGLYVAGKQAEAQAAPEAFASARRNGAVVYCVVDAQVYGKSLDAAAPTAVRAVQKNALPLSAAALRGVVEVVLPESSALRENDLVARLLARLPPPGNRARAARPEKPLPRTDAKKPFRAFHLAYALKRVTGGRDGAAKAVDTYLYSGWHASLDEAEKAARAAAQLLYCKHRVPPLCTVELTPIPRP